MNGWSWSSIFKSAIRFGWTLMSLCVVIFIFWIYRHQMMNWLSVTGSTGIIRSIIVMTIFCIIPVPAEVVMIENLRVHGEWIGIGVNFIGAILGAEILFLTARFIRRSVIHFPLRNNTYKKFLHERNRRKVIWILLCVRVLPIPAKIVDLSAGIVKSISWWDFTWTTAIGIIPYQFLALLFYHGWRTRSPSILAAGLITSLICILIWFRIRKRHKS